MYRSFCILFCYIQIGHKWKNTCSLYPQSLPLHPDSPKETISILNPCLVCNLWYECHEHLAASCGHTYHPWCFTEHARNSLACLVPDCGEEFDQKCLTAWGIRPYGEPVRTPPSLTLTNISRGSGEPTYSIFHYFMSSLFRVEYMFRNVFAHFQVLRSQG